MDGFESMSDTLDYMKMFAHFPSALRQFQRRTLTLDEAKRIVHDRMERREETFLRIAERKIYGNPQSPYLALLKWAGCELGDLGALVKRNGLEDALRELRKEGVYVSYEEFKGRKPLVRNGKTISVRARDFDNPRTRVGFTIESSGSTGLASTVNQDLDFLADASTDLLLVHALYHVTNAPAAMWSSFLPGPGFRGVFQMNYIGQPLSKWFAPSGWRDSKFWVKYDLATLYMLSWMRVFGYRAPMPQVVRPEQALTVAHWVAETLKTHRRCLLIAGVSRALRVCLAAEEAGLDLTGVVIRIGGEPVTLSKVRAMEHAGARLMSVYAMTEAGSIARSCAASSDPGDLHLTKDLHAMIVHPYQIPGSEVTVPAFNLTSLLESAPKVLLNVQLDDYGILEERACGCEFESFGYTTHLREIRSYSKLVSEGATLIGTDMLDILERVLPARFGGTSLDYQLIEQEDEQGFTRLCLLIHPRLEIADEGTVIKVVLNALGRSSPMADAARTMWQNAQTFQVQRKAPLWTASGKLTPLHLQRHRQDS